MASEAQALAADAEQRALEVVVVLVGAVAAGAMPVEDRLYPVESRLVDQGVVASGALDAVAGDDAHVVVVAQDAVDGAAR
jgi:hypothetical protein